MSRRGPAGSGARSGAVFALLAALALSGRAAAQSPCEPMTAPARDWTGPLAREIRIDAGDVTLRDALARIAGAAHVRISHSLESRPLDRRVCARLDGIPLGDALDALLGDLPVEPIAAADDHVVLSPVRTRPAPGAQTDAPEPVVPLQPILVEADPSRPANTRQDLVVDVLDGRRLAESPNGELWPTLNGVVPGMFLWSGTGVSGAWASIRGASSFESTAPKVYIDGVQVANPLLITRLSPDAIERIEVIRGPQGAALYGADAISGVLDITTRSAVSNDGPHFGFRSSVGLSATALSAGTAFAHDHGFNVSFGSATRSASFDAALGRSGEPLAGSWSRHFDAGAALRLVGRRSLFSGTFRFQSQSAATAISPVLASWQDAGSARPLLAATAVDEFALRHFTTGLRASLMPDGPWTHTFVLGIDGYHLDGEDGPAADVFQSSFGSSTIGSRALRGTLRATSSAGFRPAPSVRGTFSASFEHTLLTQGGMQSASGAPVDSSAIATAFVAGVRPLDASRHDTGLGAQLDLALHDRWFLTGGLRFEYTDALAGLGGIAALPTLGAAWTALDGPVRLKLRSAWGKGIRWPELTTGGAGFDPMPVVYVPLDLGPEQQTGIEAGFDVDLGDALSLRLTHFDQTASGLVQRVVLPADPSLAPQLRRPAWAYQNVGEITNRGWEAQGTAVRGPVTLVATFAAVDSRVRRLAWGYAGDLRPGDRMLGVPARTYGANAMWTGANWSASFGLSRATDWINYDRIALAATLLSGDDIGQPADLRDYWRRYGGVTHLSAYVTRDIDAGVALVLAGQNLLNRQSGEPDNASVLRGRTISLGVRASF